MNDTAYLILENGKIFIGKFFGAQGNITGEIVFTTGMTGYLETLTDQGYHGQIVLQTFPLIGNYGVIPADFESLIPYKESEKTGASIGVKAYIVKHPCASPSNFRSENNLCAFLKERGIIGLCGIDTRSLTKIIRENGVMNGKICSSPPTDKDRGEAKAYSVKFPIGAVSSRTVTKIEAQQNDHDSQRDPRRIALLDFGAKRSMVNALAARGCEVWIFPCETKAEEILKIKPHGIVLSNGPGDPSDPGNKDIIETIRTLDKSGITLFGICIGHQLLALSKGYSTKKLKLGHRGANQSVKDTKTGRVYVTNQNHGYEVVADSSNSSFVNVNDGTCEGLDYGNSFSVQFCPDAHGGSSGTSFIFDRFLERIDGAR